MNFALISSLSKPTTNTTNGGQEIWAANFILEEIKRNNTFDLYAIKGSIAIPESIRLFEILNKSTDEIRNDPFFQQSINKDKYLIRFISSIYLRVGIMIQKKERNYDLVIDSSALPILSTCWDLYQPPLIVIGHFPVDRAYTNFFKYVPIPQNIYFVFPSRYQLRNADYIPSNHKYFIPHGIPIEKLIYKNDPNHDIIWLSRIDPTAKKGLHEAIEVSKTVNIPLDIYGYIESQEYFNTRIKPTLTENIRLNTEIARKDIFKDYKLFLFPVQWEEAFGLVMVESMACGTPVIAFARGSISEIIKDGETGFIVNSSDEDIRGNFIVKKTGIEGLCEAVERIYSMPEEQYKEMRRAARAHVEENFTVERMVDDYEKVYRNILKG